MRAALLVLLAVAVGLVGCADSLQRYRDGCWQVGGYVVETPEKIWCVELRPGRA